MKIELVEILGNGAFADVWKAKDELGRDVAVKIIREAALNVSDALSHAKALARVNHDNVVKVYSIDKVVDPDSNEMVDGVIMELINGETLEDFLMDKTLSISELRAIGLGITDGIRHIHDQGLTHGDLHTANIMVEGGCAKIIDILYLNSLAAVSSVSRELKLQRDLISLRLILQELIHKSVLLETAAKRFNTELDYEAGVSQMREVFYNVTDVSNRATLPKTAEEMYNFLMEDGFVETEKYALALYSETPNEHFLSIFKRMIFELSYSEKHQPYIRLAWKTLSESQKTEVLQSLSEKLDVELPNGQWVSLFRMINGIGPEGWVGLTYRTKIRAEGIVVKDILAGYTDVHSGKELKSGALGTWATAFWESFDEIDPLLNNLISMLRQSWYSQNYIGNYFLDVIHAIATKGNREEEVIDALKIAVENDARKIIANLARLPQAWIDKLQ